jgi:multidrug efflux system outer membrane protein
MSVPPRTTNARLRRLFVLAGLLPGLGAIAFVSGCMLGPRYKRPAVSVPATFRNAELVTSTPSAEHSVADLRWIDIFQDAQLKEMVGEALTKNYDVKVAAQRVAESQAQLGITKAQMYPSVSAGASYNAVGIPSGLLGNSTSPHFYGGGLAANATWFLDFWGLYRRENEAARAELLATEWGRRATLSSIVIDVASAYVQLRALDAQLRITDTTIQSRQESLRLVRLRESIGATSMADVHQAEQLLYAAEAVRPQVQDEITHQEDALSLLLGRNPGPVARGRPNTEQPHPEQLPIGVPSQLLERRPDIQQAESRLIAANARIGAARAQFFPQISLTGVGGTSTSQLNRLFSSDSSYWIADGLISEPIFSGGRLRNNLHLAEATQQEMLAEYRKTVAGAFRDVADALSTYQSSKQDRIAQEKQTQAARASVALAQIQYQNGRTSYLDVLTNETNLFSAELNLATIEEREALSLVQLYASLGGGWK